MSGRPGRYNRTRSSARTDDMSVDASGEILLDATDDLDADVSTGNGSAVLAGGGNFNPAGRTFDVDADGTVTLSDDDDDAGLGDDEVGVVAIKPKSKKRLVTSHDTDEISEVNIEERKGFIKEYIKDGSGMLFSFDVGLVLFHLRNLCDNGRWVGDNVRGYQEKLPPGTEVSFLDAFHEGEDYKCISPEGFMRQATALWVGERPPHVLKLLTSEEQVKTLHREREDFLDLVNGDKFLRMAQVRGRGQITGFLTDEIGLIETSDKGKDKDGKYPDDEVTMIIFHADDLFLFGKKYKDWGHPDKIQEAFPPGLKVIFDARPVTRFRGVTGQAVAVFAGLWPSTPHPTALPGGMGSNAPCHEEVNEFQTFYYLNQNLPREMDVKFRDFERRANKSIKLQKAELSIETKEDYHDWREHFEPEHLKRSRGKRRYGDEKKKNFHQFARDVRGDGKKARIEVDFSTVKMERTEDGLYVKVEKTNQ